MIYDDDDEDYMKPTKKEILGATFWGLFTAAFVGQVLYWTFVGSAYYGVWSNEMHGKAELARAVSNREIAVREATAKRDAAVLLAEAEVNRANGVQKANEIIAAGLGGPEGYLRYLYINELGSGGKNERTVIYVPTEGLLPITEANRLQKGVNDGKVSR